MTLAPPPDKCSLTKGAMSLKNAAALSAKSINLVASENRLSPLASLPLSTDFYNRYFFNQSLSPDEWDFRGGEGVAELETMSATGSLKRLAVAEFINIRPTSGMSAMMTVILASTQPNDLVVSVRPEDGGHYATAPLVKRLGRRSALIRAEGGHLNLHDMREISQATPSLIYVDVQNTLSELDWAEVAIAFDASTRKAVLHADVSHTLGLILGRVHANPLDFGFDSMGGSTHKTFPGPQKGVIFTRSEELSEELTGAQFDTISSHHFAETLALAFAAMEFEIFGQSYARNVVTNASVLHNALVERGFMCPDKCDDNGLARTHQVWASAPDSRKISDRLAHVGIRLNVSKELPGLRGKDALRLGVSELTFCGGTPVTMELVAECLTAARSIDEHKLGGLCAELMASIGPPHFFEPLPSILAHVDSACR